MYKKLQFFIQRHPSSNSLTEQMFYYLTNLIFNSNSIHLAFAAVALRILYYLLNNKRLPPGPIGFPYIGYWPFFSHHNCHREMHKLAQKYGDIFSFMVMGRMYIHLGSYKAAKEAHVTKADCFSERMTGFSLLYSFLKDGMVTADREGWKTMRKFFFQQFRERGMTVIREAESGAIYQTIKETVAELKQQKGELVELYGVTLKQCNKIIQLTLLGRDGMTEQELQEFNSYYTYSLTSMTGKNLLFIGEIARFIFPFCLYFNEGMENHLRLRGMVNKMINKRKATYNENAIRDVVDAYFKERNDRKLRHDSTYQLFTDRCLMISLIQMIGDGCIFMGMFVSEFIKALLDHPEEQEKIYQELLQVCGMNRDPEISDKNRLMYTNAFISEVIRTTEVFTVFPSSECQKETTVCGYRIPKGAITVYNFYSAHMNVNDYEKPEKFNPSRFLTKEGERPNLLPLFGIGKRACMGEAFAMNQVFLFLTILLKNFRLSKPPDAEDTSSFLTANKINTIIELRNHK